jgi:S-(hydroxymethyl)glutathione dehydrogenase/alcohol dehydrogenase
MEVQGRRGVDPYLPHLLGHEATGVVLDRGKSVTKVDVGQAVVLGWIKGMGIEAGGTRYRRGPERINAGPVATFCETAVVSENRVVALPEGMPMDVGVLLGCALPTGAGMVIHEIQPEPGARVAVFGMGGIGLCALMALGWYECSAIIAVDIKADKLELALSLGATHAVNALDEDPIARIAEITGGQGVDYSIEAAALCHTIEVAHRVVRRNGGLCVFASHPQAGETIRIDPFDLICGKGIRGSWGGGSQPDRDVPLLVERYREGRLPLEKLISRRYTLDQINDALEDLQGHRIARALIAMDPDAA